MFVSEKSGGNFPQVEPGMHAATCYGVIDLGTQPGGEFKPQRKVLIMWELNERIPDGEHEGEPYRLSKFYTASLNEKAGLRKDLQSWRGRPFSQQELVKFNLANLIGVPALLNVSHGDNGKARIESVNPMIKGAKVETLQADRIHLDLDDYDAEAFSRLPEWIRKKVEVSPEYAQAVKLAKSKQEAAFGSLVDDDDSVPF